MKRYFYLKTSAPFFVKFNLLAFLSILCSVSVFAQTSVTIAPSADAFIRNGTYASTNYGSDVSLVVKGSTATNFSRRSYLKFPLSGVSNIVSAKLRVYGNNTESTTAISVSAHGITDDSWTESGITWNNAPSSSTAIASIGVNNVAKYYEWDVTNYVKSEFAGNKVASFALRNVSNQNLVVSFNSKENASNKPQLVITTSGSTTSSNALLFIENLDKFPSNDHFVASRIQNRWTRDTVAPFRYNANHDTARIRIHNKGMGTLTINNLILSNTSTWKFLKLEVLH